MLILQKLLISAFLKHLLLGIITLRFASYC